MLLSLLTLLIQCLTVELLDITDLSRLLGLTEKAIYNRRHREGALPPAIKLGTTTLRWHPADVEAWLAERRESEVNGG